MITLVVVTISLAGGAVLLVVWLGAASQKAKKHHLELFEGSYSNLVVDCDKLRHQFLNAIRTGSSVPNQIDRIGKKRVELFNKIFGGETNEDFTQQELKDAARKKRSAIKTEFRQRKIRQSLLTAMVASILAVSINLAGYSWLSKQGLNSAPEFIDGVIGTQPGLLSAPELPASIDGEFEPFEPSDVSISGFGSVDGQTSLLRNSRCISATQLAASFLDRTEAANV